MKNMPRFLRFGALPMAIGVLAASSAAAAESPGPLQQAIGNPADWNITASVRVRYETLDGGARAGFEPDSDLIAIKSTLAIEYKSGALWIGAQLDDSRIYRGSADGSVTANDVNTFEPVQAYVGLDLGDALGKGSKTSLLGGRFMTNLGSRRFLSSDEYRNATSAYTGLRVDFKAAEGTAATLFYLLPQLHLPDDQPSILANRGALDKETFDLQLFGAVVSHPRTLAGAAAELGFYRLRERDAPGRATRDRDLYTLTARLVREAGPGRFDFEVEGAWQLGQISASSAAQAKRLRVDAGMVHAGIGYSFKGPARLRVALAYDWISGDSPGSSYSRFDTLYGYRRGEYGPSGLFSAIGRANLSAPSVRLEATPGKRFDALAVYRPMWLASRFDSFSTTGVIDKAGASGRFAGHQIDSRVRYWLMPGLLLLTG